MDSVASESQALLQAHNTCPAANIHLLGFLCINHKKKLPDKKYQPFFSSTNHPNPALSYLTGGKTGCRTNRFLLFSYICFVIVVSKF